jgi:hypothetical protein
MGIDAPGRDHPAGDVDLLPSGRQTLAEHGNAAAHDADVGIEAVTGGRNTRTAQHQIEAGRTQRRPPGAPGPCTAVGKDDNKLVDMFDRARFRCSFARMGVGAEPASRPAGDGLAMRSARR